MLKKVGVSLLAAMMLSSVALACDHLSIDDEDFLWDFSLVDDGVNKQVSKQEERKVVKFDKEVVKKIMMENKKYTDFWISIAIPRLSNCDVKLQGVLDMYIADRTISSDFNVEGVTMQKIMETMHCDFFDAFSFMDMYIKKPEMAKELLTIEIPYGIE